jgi:hypothetical protein
VLRSATSGDVRERALIHVGGPLDSGKTAFVETLLQAHVALAISVRAERDPKLRTERESAPKAHAELRRYREAGASAAALYRFAEPNNDAFFTSDVMQDYSEAVLVEGDCPIEHVDLRVYVAPPLRSGASLLRRVRRDHASAHRAGLAAWARALESDEGLAALLPGMMREPILAAAFADSGARAKVRTQMADELERMRSEPPPAPTEHWAVAAGYEGIERAQLVIVNVRNEDARANAERLVGEIAQLRKDVAVRKDVLGPYGHRLPVTAVAANLSEARDPGCKKAISRVRRAIPRR